MTVLRYTLYQSARGRVALGREVAFTSQSRAISLGARSGVQKRSGGRQQVDVGHRGASLGGLPTQQGKRGRQFGERVATHAKRLRNLYDFTQIRKYLSTIRKWGGLCNSMFRHILE